MEKDTQKLQRKKQRNLRNRNSQIASEVLKKDLNFILSTKKQKKEIKLKLDFEQIRGESVLLIKLTKLILLNLQKFSDRFELKDEIFYNLNEAEYHNLRWQFKENFKIEFTENLEIQHFLMENQVFLDVVDKDWNKMENNFFKEISKKIEKFSEKEKELEEKENIGKESYKVALKEWRSLNQEEIFEEKKLKIFLKKAFEKNLPEEFLTEIGQAVSTKLGFLEFFELVLKSLEEARNELNESSNPHILISDDETYEERTEELIIILSNSIFKNNFPSEFFLDFHKNLNHFCTLQNREIYNTLPLSSVKTLIGNLKIEKKIEEKFNISLDELSDLCESNFIRNTVEVLLTLPETVKDLENNIDTVMEIYKFNQKHLNLLLENHLIAEIEKLNLIRENNVVEERLVSFLKISKFSFHELPRLISIIKKTAGDQLREVMFSLEMLKFPTLLPGHRILIFENLCGILKQFQNMDEGDNLFIALNLLGRYFENDIEKKFENLNKFLVNFITIKSLRWMFTGNPEYQNTLKNYLEFFKTIEETGTKFVKNLKENFSKELKSFLRIENFHNLNLTPTQLESCIKGHIYPKIDFLMKELGPEFFSKSPQVQKQEAKGKRGKKSRGRGKKKRNTNNHNQGFDLPKFKNELKTQLGMIKMQGKKLKKTQELLENLTDKKIFSRVVFESKKNSEDSGEKKSEGKKKIMKVMGKKPKFAVMGKKKMTPMGKRNKSKKEELKEAGEEFEMKEEKIRIFGCVVENDFTLNNLEIVKNGIQGDEQDVFISAVLSRFGLYQRVVAGKMSHFDEIDFFNFVKILKKSNEEILDEVQNLEKARPSALFLREFETSYDDIVEIISIFCDQRKKLKLNPVLILRNLQLQMISKSEEIIRISTETSKKNFNLEIEKFEIELKKFISEEDGSLSEKVIFFLENKKVFEHLSSLSAIKNTYLNYLKAEEDTETHFENILSHKDFENSVLEVKDLDSLKELVELFLIIESQSKYNRCEFGDYIQMVQENLSIFSGPFFKLDERKKIFLEISQKVSKIEKVQEFEFEDFLKNSIFWIFRDPFGKYKYSARLNSGDKFGELSYKNLTKFRAKFSDEGESEKLRISPEARKVYLNLCNQLETALELIEYINELGYISNLKNSIDFFYCQDHMEKCQEFTQEPESIIGVKIENYEFDSVKKLIQYLTKIQKYLDEDIDEKLKEYSNHWITFLKFETIHQIYDIVIEEDSIFEDLEKEIERVLRYTDLPYNISFCTIEEATLNKDFDPHNMIDTLMAVSSLRSKLGVREAEIMFNSKGIKKISVYPLNEKFSENMLVFEAMRQQGKTILNSWRFYEKSLRLKFFLRRALFDPFKRIYFVPYFGTLSEAQQEEFLNEVKKILSNEYKKINQIEELEAINFNLLVLVDKNSERFVQLKNLKNFQEISKKILEKKVKKKLDEETHKLVSVIDSTNEINTKLEQEIQKSKTKVISSIHVGEGKSTKILQEFEKLKKFGIEKEHILESGEKTIKYDPRPDVEYLCLELSGNLKFSGFELGKYEKSKNVFLHVKLNSLAPKFVNDVRELDLTIFKILFLRSFWFKNFSVNLNKVEYVYVEVSNSLNLVLEKISTLEIVKKSKSGIFSIELVSALGYKDLIREKVRNLENEHHDEFYSKKKSEIIDFEKEAEIYFKDLSVVEFDIDVADEEYNFKKIEKYIFESSPHIRKKFDNMLEMLPTLNLKSFRQLKDLSLTLEKIFKILNFLKNSQKENKKALKREIEKITQKLLSQLPLMIGDDTDLINSQQEYMKIYKDYFNHKSDESLTKFQSTRVNKNFKIFNNFQNLICPYNDLLEDLSRIKSGKTQEYYLEKLSGVIKINFEILVERKKKFEENEKIDFVLTKDTYVKIMAVLSRVYLELPIIIQGETGSGKSLLIKFIAECLFLEHLETLIFNSGTREIDIKNFLIKIAKNHKNENCWVLFDEFNTSPIQSSLDSLFIEKSYLGRNYEKKNLKFVGLCNPFKIKKDKPRIGLVQEMSASILTHKVEPISNKLAKYVLRWDQVPKEVLERFIRNFLSEKREKWRLQKKADFFQNFDDKKSKYCEILIITSINFIIEIQNESAVSLRDIDRFFKILEKITNLKNTKKLSSEDTLHITTCLCFMLRIPTEREKEKLMRNILKKSKKEKLKIKDQNFLQSFEEFTYEYIKEAKGLNCVPKNTSLNQPLRENFFASLIAISLHLPLIICGKPGTSKTLSLTIIKKILNLPISKKKGTLFEGFSQSVTFNYWGSVNTESSDIESLFKTATKSIKKSKKHRIIIFDEIGLAEVSPHRPLKVLNRLLGEQPMVSFVGLTNWDLDVSIMSRMLYVARPDMEESDLVITAHSIMGNDEFEICEEEEKILFEMHDLTFKMFAVGYGKLNNIENYSGCSNFHGTRDFYTLVKFFSRNFDGFVKVKKNKYKMIILEVDKEGYLEMLLNSVSRNFSGKELSGKNSSQLIKEAVLDMLGQPEFKKLDMSKLEEVRIENLKLKKTEENDVFKYLRSNLTEPNSRPLMLFTEGGIVDDLILNYITKILVEKKGENYKGKIVRFKDSTSKLDNFQVTTKLPFMIQNGYTVVLQNFHQVYSCLYEVLNQKYHVINGENYSYLFFGEYKEAIKVHKDFKCIVLIESEESIEFFDKKNSKMNMKEMEQKRQEQPSPFLNRFEKHLFRYQSLLSPKETRLLEDSKDFMFNYSRRYKVDKNFSLPALIHNFSTELIFSLCLKGNCFDPKSEIYGNFGARSELQGDIEGVYKVDDYFCTDNCGSYQDVLMFRIPKFFSVFSKKMFSYYYYNIKKYMTDSFDKDQYMVKILKTYQDVNKFENLEEYLNEFLGSEICFKGVLFTYSSIPSLKNIIEKREDKKKFRLTNPEEIIKDGVLTRAKSINEMINSSGIRTLIISFKGKEEWKFMNEFKSILDSAPLPPSKKVLFIGHYLVDDLFSSKMVKTGFNFETTDYLISQSKSWNMRALDSLHANGFKEFIETIDMDLLNLVTPPYKNHLNYLKKLIQQGFRDYYNQFVKQSKDLEILEFMVENFSDDKFLVRKLKKSIEKKNDSRLLRRILEINMNKKTGMKHKSKDDIIVEPTFFNTLSLIFKDDFMKIFEFVESRAGYVGLYRIFKKYSETESEILRKFWYEIIEKKIDEEDGNVKNQINRNPFSQSSSFMAMFIKKIFKNKGKSSEYKMALLDWEKAKEMDKPEEKRKILNQTPEIVKKILILDEGNSKLNSSKIFNKDLSTCLIEMDNELYKCSEYVKGKVLEVTDLVFEKLYPGRKGESLISDLARFHTINLFFGEDIKQLILILEISIGSEEEISRVIQNIFENFTEILKIKILNILKKNLKIENLSLFDKSAFEKNISTFTSCMSLKPILKSQKESLTYIKFIEAMILIFKNLKARILDYEHMQAVETIYNESLVFKSPHNVETDWNNLDRLMHLIQALSKLCYFNKQEILSLSEILIDSTDDHEIYILREKNYEENLNVVFYEKISCFLVEILFKQRNFAILYNEYIFNLFKLTEYIAVFIKLRSFSDLETEIPYKDNSILRAINKSFEFNTQDPKNKLYKNFCIILTDRLTFYLDSIFKSNDIGVLGGISSKKFLSNSENLVLNFLLEMKNLFEPEISDKKYGQKLKENKKLSMIILTSFFRFWVQNWQNFKITLEDFYPMFDSLLLNHLKDKNIPICIRSFSVHFCQKLMIDNDTFEFLAPLGMRTLSVFMKKISSMAAGIYMFEPPKEEENDFVSEHKAVYISMFAPKLMRKYIKERRIGSKFDQIFNNNVFTQKKDYLQKDMVGLIGHLIGVLQLLNGRPWLYQGLTSETVENRVENYLYHYCRVMPSSYDNILHRNENIRKENENIMKKLTIPLLCNSLSKKEEKIVSALRFIYECGCGTDQAQANRETRLTKMWQCVHCGEVFFATRCGQFENESTTGQSKCLGCGVNIGRGYASNIEGITYVVNSRLSSTLEMYSKKMLLFPLVLHTNYDKEVGPGGLPCLSVAEYVFGRIINHGIFLKLFYENFDFLNIYFKEARLIDKSKLEALLNEGMKKKLGKEELDDIPGEKWKTMFDIDSEKYLIERILQDFQELRKIYNLDKKSFKLLMDWVIYKFYDQIKTRHMNTTFPISNLFLNIRSVLQDVFKNKSKYIDKYIELLKLPSMKNTLKVQTTGLWFSNMISNETIKVLNFTPSDVSIVKLLRHIGVVSLSHIKKSIADKKENYVLSDYFTKSHLLSVIQPLMTTYLRMIQIVKNVYNFKLSVKKINKIYLENFFQDPEISEDSKTELRELYHNFRDIWLDKVEPLADRFDQNKLFFKFQCSSVKTSEMLEFGESLKSPKTTKLFYFILCDEKNLVVDDDRLMMQLNKMATISKSIIESICEIQNKFILQHERVFNEISDENMQIPVTKMKKTQWIQAYSTPEDYIRRFVYNEWREIDRLTPIYDLEKITLELKLLLFKNTVKILPLETLDDNEYFRFEDENDLSLYSLIESYFMKIGVIMDEMAGRAQLPACVQEILKNSENIGVVMKLETMVKSAVICLKENTVKELEQDIFVCLDQGEIEKNVISLSLGAEFEEEFVSMEINQLRSLEREISISKFENVKEDLKPILNQISNKKEKLMLRFGLKLLDFEDLDALKEMNMEFEIFVVRFFVNKRKFGKIVGLGKGENVDENQILSLEYTCEFELFGGVFDEVYEAADVRDIFWIHEFLRRRVMGVLNRNEFC